MKSIIRYVVIYLVFNSSAYAIVDGSVDGSNTYSSVGYTITAAGGLGSLVVLDSNWVLTAAHVLDDAAPAFLVLGNPNDDAPPGAEGLYFFIEQTVLHPMYTPGEFHDDLALIKVSSADPIDPMSSVQVNFATLSNVALDSTSPDFLPLPGTSTITGYGRTEVLGPDPTDLLRNQGASAIYVDDPFATLGVTPFDPGFPTDCAGAQLLCTYSTGEPPSADAGGAPGDSGGGMFVDYGGGEVVGAINSFIFDENDIDPADFPTADWTNGYWTVGTSTAYYEDWIRGVVQGDGGTVRFGSSPVPLPPAFYLFAAGLVGLAGTSRRRNRQDA